MTQEPSDLLLEEIRMLRHDLTSSTSQRRERRESPWSWFARLATMLVIIGVLGSWVWMLALESAQVAGIERSVQEIRESVNRDEAVVQGVRDKVDAIGYQVCGKCRLPGDPPPAAKHRPTGGEGGGQ